MFQGWNKAYPFNTGDLIISMNVLFNYLEANNRIPWEDLRYLFGEIMYGGHITGDGTKPYLDSVKFASPNCASLSLPLPDTRRLCLKGIKLDCLLQKQKNEMQQHCFLFMPYSVETNCN